MSRTTRVAVVHCSATGPTHELAQEIAAGALAAARYQDERVTPVAAARTSEQAAA
jgi:hypothetical protein